MPGSIDIIGMSFKAPKWEVVWQEGGREMRRPFLEWPEAFSFRQLVFSENGQTEIRPLTKEEEK